jgi:hypothetical protein
MHFCTRLIMQMAIKCGDKERPCRQGYRAAPPKRVARASRSFPLSRRFTSSCPLEPVSREPSVQRAAPLRPPHSYGSWHCDVRAGGPSWPSGPVKDSAKLTLSDMLWCVVVLLLLASSSSSSSFSAADSEVIDELTEVDKPSECIFGLLFSFPR